MVIGMCKVPLHGQDGGLEVDSSLKWHFYDDRIGRKKQHMNQGAKIIAPEPANIAVSCH